MQGPGETCFFVAKIFHFSGALENMLVTSVCYSRSLCSCTLAQGSVQVQSKMSYYGGASLYLQFLSIRKRSVKLPAKRLCCAVKIIPECRGCQFQHFQCPFLYLCANQSPMCFCSKSNGSVILTCYHVAQLHRLYISTWLEKHPWSVGLFRETRIEIYLESWAPAFTFCTVRLYFYCSLLSKQYLTSVTVTAEVRNFLMMRSSSFITLCLLGAANIIRAAQPYWLEEIKHQGISAFNIDPSSYQVFRNVKDFGAIGKSESLFDNISWTLSQATESQTIQLQFKMPWALAADAAMVVNPTQLHLPLCTSRQELIY